MKNVTKADWTRLNGFIIHVTKAKQGVSRASDATRPSMLPPLPWLTDRAVLWGFHFFTEVAHFIRIAKSSSLDDVHLGNKKHDK